MKNIHVFCLTTFFCIALFGCNVTSEQVENVNEGVIKEAEENKSNDSNSIDVLEENIVLKTGPSETVTRKNEGVDQEIKVLTYEIQPFSISYQLDEIFTAPEVKENQIIYSTQNDEYTIVLEIIKQKNIEETVLSLQEKFGAKGYEEKGELERTPLDENHLVGKMQSFLLPMKGFFAYQIDDDVLVITYEYPIEAGDAMHPLLVDLRKSITIK